jgi:hypothetical protein
MNDMFMSDFGAAYPIIRDPARPRPSQCATSHERSRTRAKSRHPYVKETRCPSLHSLGPAVIQSKGLGLAMMQRRKQSSRLNAALRWL